jgi:hypothetical protein
MNTSIAELQNRWNIYPESYDTLTSTPKPWSNSLLSDCSWSFGIFMSLISIWHNIAWVEQLRPMRGLILNIKWLEGWIPFTVWLVLSNDVAVSSRDWRSRGWFCDEIAWGRSMVICCEVITACPRDRWPRCWIEYSTLHHPNYKALDDQVVVCIETREYRTTCSDPRVMALLCVCGPSCHSVMWGDQCGLTANLTLRLHQILILIPNIVPVTSTFDLTRTHMSPHGTMYPHTPVHWRKPPHTKFSFSKIGYVTLARSRELIPIIDTSQQTRNKSITGNYPPCLRREYRYVNCICQSHLWAWNLF